MIPESVKARIEKEALKKYCSPYGKDNPETHAYIAGATAEYKRAQALKKALKKLIHLSNTWGREWFSKEDWNKIKIAREALKKY